MPQMQLLLRLWLSCRISIQLQASLEKYVHSFQNRWNADSATERLLIL